MSFFLLVSAEMFSVVTMLEFENITKLLQIKLIDLYKKYLNLDSILW